MNNDIMEMIVLIFTTMFLLFLIVAQSFEIKDLKQQLKISQEQIELCNGEKK